MANPLAPKPGPYQLLVNLQHELKDQEYDDNTETDISSLVGADVEETLKSTIWTATEYKRVKSLAQLLPLLKPGTREMEMQALLCAAVAWGHAATVRMLIEKGATAHDKYRGRPLLHMAALCGHTDVVEVLVECGGVSVNTLDRNGDHVLYHVVTSEHKDKDTTVKWLISHGAHTHTKSSAGKYLLHVAATNTPNVLDLLLEQGQYVNMTDDVNNDTPLHLACNMSCHESIVVLIKHGCRFNALNKHGDTPLMKLLQQVKGPIDFHSRTRIALAKKLINIGFRAHRSKQRSSGKRRQPTGRDKVFDKYLELKEQVNEVPPLQNIARLAVRDSLELGMSTKKYALTLDIPEHLKSFIMFSELATL